MKAAVVSSFNRPPRCEEFSLPSADAADEMIVDVIAAGLHPRVLSQADGSHYTSTGELPFVPGIDGVGRGADGKLRYFILPDTRVGSMGQRTVIDARRSIVLRDDSDPIAVAAGMNPAMSSWIALRRRVQFQAGESVLVLGATGNAGRMAVQVAKLFGAKEIIAAGRNRERLAELHAAGATAIVALSNDDDGLPELGHAAARVDVVLDYLWGEPTAGAMIAVVKDRADRGQSLTWIEIGSVAGPTASIPSAALRATRLQIVGSGQGSVSTRDILAELPALAKEITRGTFDVAARAVPLADVERVWSEAARSPERIVLTP